MMITITVQTSGEADHERREPADLLLQRGEVDLLVSHVCLLF